MTDQTPSDEVLLEAARRAKWSAIEIENCRTQYGYGGGFRALCDLLVETGFQPPVSPELRAARQARDEINMGGNWSCEQMALRAIELCDQYRKEAGQ